jgi:hypothetical protein
MRRRHEAGVWELFIPAVQAGDLYQFEILGAEDANWVEEFYLDADVYVPEMANWTPQGIERFQKVARGDSDAPCIVETYTQNVLSETHNITRHYGAALMKMLARSSGKHLCAIDVPAGTELGNRLRTARAYVGIYPQALRELLRLQKPRETQMILNLSPALGSLLRTHPELCSKETLKVLLTLGSDHKNISKPLAKRGEHVRCFFKSP